ncbi:MAG: transporter substrate-binding domain-containing protein [Acidimicrobiales bacterium]
MTEIEPFVENDGGRADGFYAEIWDVVADEMGVDYDVIWVESFPELLVAIDEGRAEVAVAPLAPTAEREAAFDFTSAVISSGPQLGYHSRTLKQGSLWGALASGAVRQILLFAILGLAILAHLIWLVERNRTDEEGSDFDSGYLRGIWDGFWWATVTVTTVGYGDKAPRSTGGRVIALLAMLLSLFLVGAFVSQVTEILQETRSEAPIATLEDVGDNKVGVVAGSTFAAYVEAEGITTIAYPTQSEVFEAIERGDIDIMVANPFALSTVGARYDVTPAGSVLYEEFETFGVAQGSLWREPINQVLANLQASGEVEEITNRWLD